MIVYDNTVSEQTFPKYLGDCPLCEGVHYYNSLNKFVMCYKINWENKPTKYKIIGKDSSRNRYLSIINKQTNNRVPDPYDL